MSTAIDAHCVNCGVRKPKSSAQMKRFLRSERTFNGLESGFLSTSTNQEDKNPMLSGNTSTFSSPPVDTEDGFDIFFDSYDMTNASISSAIGLSIGPGCLMR